MYYKKLYQLYSITTFNNRKIFVQISLVFGTYFAGRFLSLLVEIFKKMKDNDLWCFYLSAVLHEDK